MAKWCNEKAVEFLDNLMMTTALGAASDRSGIHPMTVSRWRLGSEEGLEQYQAVEYQGLVQPFHRHVEDVFGESVEQIESEFRRAAAAGHTHPLVYRGEFSYEDDEEALLLQQTDEQAFKDMCDLGVMYPDAKKRAINPKTGVLERIKVMITEAPSVDRQVKVLSSWSERYADKRSHTVNVSGFIGGGVMTVPNKPLIEAVTVVQAAITDATDADFSEINDVEQPEPIEPEAEPDAPVPEVDSLTQEQIDIRERLRSSSPLVVELAQLAQENLDRRIAATPAPIQGFKIG